MKSLEDLRQKCRIEEETGCWNWGMAISNGSSGSLTPRLHFKFPWNDRAQVRPAHAVAYYLSKRTLRDGQFVWRTCLNSSCVNPAHLMAGTPREMHDWQRESGVLRGFTHRKVANMKNYTKMATPRERVMLAEDMFRDGALLKHVMTALRMSNETAAAIRDGRHVNSSTRNVVANASIFTWRPTV